MKRLLTTLLKFSISFAILAYLITDIQNKAPDTFAAVVTEAKNWWCLGGAVVTFTLALLVGLARWHMLTRLLGIPLSFAQLLRMACFAYVVEILSIGLAGADAARATMLSRAVPGATAPAIVSVLVDRTIGAYVLLCYVSFNAWLLQPTAPVVVAAAHTLQALAASVTGALLLWLLFPRIAPWAAQRASALGKVGRFAAESIHAVDTFRDHGAVLAIAALLTSVVMLLSTTSFYLIAQGVPGGSPTWQEHSVIVPMLLLSAVVPLPMQGLGVVDYTLSYLYQNVPVMPPQIGQGLIVAMGIRIASILIGGAAATYYALTPVYVPPPVRNENL